MQNLINILALLFLNFNVPIIIYLLYKFSNTKQHKLRKLLYISSAVSIAAGEILIFLLITNK
jgi:hypothetical protein